MSEWQDGGRAARTERFRHALALAENGQPEEAVLCLQGLLNQPALGRRLRCKVHTVLSRLLSPTDAGRALLHAEEAMRLADVVLDPWLRAEALAQAVDLLLAQGNLPRARAATTDLQQELVRQPGALSGGPAHGFWLLGRVLRASGEAAGAHAAFTQAEAMLPQSSQSHMLWEIRTERAAALLDAGRVPEARNLIILVNAATAGSPLPRALLLEAAASVLSGSSAAAVLLRRAEQMASGRHALLAQVLAWRARHCPEERDWAERALSAAALSGRWDVAAEVQAVLQPLATLAVPG